MGDTQRRRYCLSSYMVASMIPHSERGTRVYIQKGRVRRTEFWLLACSPTVWPSLLDYSSNPVDIHKNRKRLHKSSHVVVEKFSLPQKWTVEE